MKNQYVFERYEIKYLINTKQYYQLKKVIEEYAVLDDYGISSIRNIYYDTNTYQIIRNSLEKPNYKEKLRARTYKTIKDDDEIFLEMKNKCNGIVYKRRTKIPSKYLNNLNEISDNTDTQIKKEISCFINRYDNLKPVMYISYDRLAYRSVSDSTLRITFDYNIRYRNYNLTLNNEPYGECLLEDDKYLLEIKTCKALPLWLVSELSKLKIYKTNFSKYGLAYCKIINKESEKKYGII